MAGWLVRGRSVQAKAFREADGGESDGGRCRRRNFSSGRLHALRCRRMSASLGLDALPPQ